MNAAQLQTINCTQCGAALPALAGHRARSLTCGYCGAVMDRHEGYRVLARYRDMQRPSGPFRIGMRGEIGGVPHTIIGIVGWDTRQEGQVYSWTDYQLYSPTHGYSWLTWNDGHLVHTRRVREAPDHPGPHLIAPGGRLSAMGLDFTVFEQYEARIFYVEGELTWIAEIGESAQVVEAIDPPFGFAVERSDEEEEYGFSIYLDREAVLDSFGVTQAQARPRGVHPIQPFEPGTLHPALAKAARMVLPFAAVLALAAFLFGSGSRVAQQSFAPPAQGGALRFEAPYTDRLMSIVLRAPVANSWAWWDFSLTHEETETTVVELSEGVEYYYGYEGGERWTEGSREAQIRFRPPATGSYLLEIEGVEEGSANVPLTVTVRRDVFVSRYFIAVTILLALIAVSLWSRRKAFEKARWGADDEEGDDD